MKLTKVWTSLKEEEWTRVPLRERRRMRMSADRRKWESDRLFGVRNDLETERGGTYENR